MKNTSEKKNNEIGYDKLNDEQKGVSIPYFVHEMEMTRLERINKRLWIFLLVLLLALVGTNAGWIIYESQFETYTYEQTTRADNAAAIGIMNTGEGDVNFNGDGKTNNKDSGEEEQFQEPVEGVPHL